MSLADIITTKHELRPPLGIVHGGPGVGKTHLGSTLPNPIFMLTEPGLGKIQVDAIKPEQNATWDDFMANLEKIRTEKHDYKSLIVDSLDWLQPLCHDKTCKEMGYASIESAGYGKGYTESLKFWRQYIDLLNTIRDERKMTILQLAHSQVKRFEPPEAESYDRWELKLDKKVGELMLEHVDFCFYAAYETGVAQEKGSNGKLVSKTRTTKRRICHTTWKPHWVAKNRYALPEVLDMDWSVIRSAIIGEASESKAKAKDESS